MQTTSDEECAITETAKQIGEVASKNQTNLDVGRPRRWVDPLVGQREAERQERLRALLLNIPRITTAARHFTEQAYSEATEAAREHAKGGGSDSCGARGC